MKRLVWLLLAVFCTALAQVQPVELPVSKGASCSCCKIPGACGLPDCGQPPVPAAGAYTAEQPARIAQIPTRRNVARSGRVIIDFLACDAGSATSAVVAFSSRVPTVSPVPLFKAYRSFLI